MKRFKILENLKKADAEYYEKFNAILRYYKPIIDSGALIREVGYTPHDVENHCDNIYRILSDILPESFYQKYPYGENLFLLCVGILLHDLEMAYDVSDEVRRKHSKLAKERINKECYSNENTILKASISRDFVDALEDIVYAHSDIKDENNVIEVFTLQKVLEKYNKDGLSKGINEEINVPYLAAVLRLADELDLDYNRICRIGYEQKYNIETSKQHFEKCKYFKKVQINSRNLRELVLRVDNNVFDSLDESEKQTAAAQIIRTYDKVVNEFLKMKDSILFNTMYASELWNIECIKLNEEEKFREYLKKKSIDL